ncbi:MAG: hypothetical protein RIQ33_955 [Bacteroidota bacterium]|jgi:hypothetical protein
MHTQFITNDAGKKVAAILSMSDYEKYLDDLDEIKAIKAFDKATSKKMELVSFEQAIKDLKNIRSKNV